MLLTIINKILIVLFFLACLNILRRCYYMIQALLTSTEDSPRKYILNDKTLLILGVSIAYVLSVIFTGLQI